MRQLLMRSGRWPARPGIGVTLKVSPPPVKVKSPPMVTVRLPRSAHLRLLELLRTFHNPKFIL